MTKDEIKAIIAEETKELRSVVNKHSRAIQILKKKFEIVELVSGASAVYSRVEDFQKTFAAELKSAGKTDEEILEAMNTETFRTGLAHVLRMK